MKARFLVLLLAGATSLAACKKNNNNNPGSTPEDFKVPVGIYNLTQSVKFDSAGTKADTVKFEESDLSLTFDQVKKTASVSGSPEIAKVIGGYVVKANNVLADAVIKTTKISGTENDAIVVALLEKVEAYEAKNEIVTMKTKDKSYLVFTVKK